jgi:hypothetical protein
LKDLSENIVGKHQKIGVRAAPPDQLHACWQVLRGADRQGDRRMARQVEGRTSRVSGTTARASCASARVGGTMGRVGRTSASASASRASISRASWCRRPVPHRRHRRRACAGLQAGAHILTHARMIGMDAQRGPVLRPHDDQAGVESSFEIGQNTVLDDQRQA